MRTKIVSITAAALLTFGGAGAALAVDPSTSPGASATGTTTTPTTTRRDDPLPIGLLGLLGLAGLLGLRPRERPPARVVDREDSAAVR